MQYRAFARLAGMAALVAAISAQSPAPPARTARPVVTVYKDPNCGCCRSWIEHLKQHGFDVVAHDTPDMSGPKATAHVPQKLYSCHTAFVGGYAIEGHVPAADIQRLLKEKPRIAGLSAPGMPTGAPGMEVGKIKDKYDVIAFTRDGRTSVFAHH